MPLKTSWFNKEMIKQDFRSAGWISIVYFLGLFFLGPLQLFMILSREEPRMNFTKGLFGDLFGFHVQMIFLFVMPVLMAVFLFRYLHVKEASDFAHSFPMKRGKLFNHHIASGLLLLLVPILLNYVIFLISAVSVNLTDYYTLAELGYWLWLFSFVTILIFMTAVFIGTLTGLSAVQGILTYILLLFPAGIYGLISYHLTSYINGFSGDIAMNRHIEYFSPIVDVATYSNTGMYEAGIPVQPIALVIYGAAAILFYLSAWTLYKKRRMESASRAIAVTKLNPVFKFGVMFCFALFGGMYFGLTQHSYGWMAAGYIIGGTFGYFAAVMLLEKNWRVFKGKHIKGWTFYGMGTGLLIFIIPLFWQSYESFIPEQENVKQVYLGDHYYQYERGEDLTYISSPDAIKSVIELHEDLIEESTPMNGGNNYFFLAYQMENGEEVFRQYQVDKHLDSIKEVFETDEYKEIRYPALGLNNSDIQKLTLQTRLNNQEQTIVEPERIKEFMGAVREDLYHLSYEQLVNPKGMSSWVTFLVEGEEDNPYEMRVYPSYDQTAAWLKEEGLYESFFIQADDIEKAEIYAWPEEKEYSGTHARFVFDRLREDGVTPLEVRGEEKVDRLLQARGDKEQGAYIVVLYLDESNPDYNEVLSFEEDEAPAFIKQHFE
ncbi:DUF6449 domain-containing protein [Halobacillus litoralis]|uniref:DUF6449 domain-containing protein n=1 Tax=Halobacillus litoralis TaxID=45668 RepID=UPI001CFF4A00|nr:DUF6449 domain-containing protein [Halobacillus litoralis]